MLRVALQTKGRLSEKSIELLSDAGINLETGKRLLLLQAKNFPLEVLFLRDDDIPQSVADGTSDVGIVGENEYIEKGSNAKIIKRLGFSRCRLSLAVPKDSDYETLTWFNHKVIATSYPNILKSYLSEKNIQADIHEISGSVEVAPGIGLADAIFDIVSSGSTLIANHLKEVEVVMNSEAVLIEHASLSDEKRQILNELLFRINSVLIARDKKYLLMNVPTANLDEIVKVLPSMTSPTIMPLAQQGWSSLHAVVGEKESWKIIGKLKKHGAEGILVLPIEKMIL